MREHTTILTSPPPMRRSSAHSRTTFSSKRRCPPAVTRHGSRRTQPTTGWRRADDYFARWPTRAFSRPAGEREDSGGYSRRTSSPSAGDRRRSARGRWRIATRVSAVGSTDTRYHARITLEGAAAPRGDPGRALARLSMRVMASRKWRTAMVPAREAGSMDSRTAIPERPMGVHLAGLSDDARVLLRLISHRTSLHTTFTAADVEAVHPDHRAVAGATAQRFEEAEITCALDELSREHGWLGSFVPGRYVFRALAHDGAVDGADRAAHPSS